MRIAEVRWTALHGRIVATCSRLSVPTGRSRSAILLVAYAAGISFVAWHLNQGWVPHDDGAFAQSAQRVLDGQLPHRDFTELYTGGLTFLNAAAFALFGENLIWLRVPMFLLFVAYVPCVYLLARRFVPCLVALLAAAFAVAWGPATYPAAVPSWYLLFFSVFGALALIRYLKTRQMRWLVVGGLFGGMAITFKIVGVWYVLAVLFFLVFFEQEGRGKRESRISHLTGYGLLVGTGVLLSLALIVGLMRTHLGGAEVANLIVPIAALAALVIANETRVEAVPMRERLSAVLGLVLPFLAGVAAPVILLLIPYVATGSIRDLVTGVFISPQSRMEDTYVSTPDPVLLLVAAPLVVALLARWRGSRRTRRLIDVAGIVLLALLLGTSGERFSYTVLWDSAREIAPFVVIGGAAALAFLPDRLPGREGRPTVFLLLALAAFSSLIQFPFGAPIYYCYLASLVALAALAVLQYASAAGGWLPVAILATYVLFGFGWLAGGVIYVWGVTPERNPQNVVLDSRSASIRVTSSDRLMYREVVRLLRSHAYGRYTYAGPDAPEVYFLSGLENPTRSLFDHLDPSNSARGERLLRTLQDRGVNAVTINLSPRFSDELDRATLRRLRQRYPSRVRVGPFDVRWRTVTP